MTGPRAIRLTAWREIRERARSRAFRVGVAVQILIVIAIVVVAALSDGGTTTYKVGLTGAEAAEIGRELSEQSAADAEIEVSTPASAAAARSEVAAGDLDAAVADRALIVPADPDDELTALIQLAAGRVESESRLRAAGLDSAQIEAALDPKPLPIADAGGESGSGSGIAFAGTLLLYIAIFSFGFVVTTGIVEEKSSRVVELILAAIRPSQLLAGKVIGIGLLGFAQLAAVAGIGVAAALLSGQIELPSSTLSTLALVLVYFLLGYALYSCAFAVAGAIVSRQEDVGSVTTPLSIVLVVGYLLSFSTSDDPSGALATICTLLPPTAPMVVPARAAVDGLPTAELIASLVLMLLAVAALVRLAGRIYERAVLRVGAPMKLTEGLRLARRG
ncbi:MAG TPA: ABC transporter permease [Solirubrobacterales bacterium]|nr:ABC transporter permease [Solirubrobacterales bacterium]